jgi:hypothetical protein
MKGKAIFSRNRRLCARQIADDKFDKEVIKRLIARVHRVESGSWYLLTNNAAKHSYCIVSQFLVIQGIPLLSHPPHFPDLGLPDFFLFPRLKNAMKGTRFEFVMDCDDVNIYFLSLLYSFIGSF